MKDKKKKQTKSVFGLILFVAMMIAIVVALIGGAAYMIFRPYKITVDLADGSEPITRVYTVNAGKINLGIPERSGYCFTGWTGSNGNKPQVNITVGNGMLGNLSYTANWSDDLNVTCEDWIIDKNGNMIRDISDEIDEFLESGGSGKNYSVQKRTIQVKPGTLVSVSRWGDDKDYKAYSDKYIYVGSSENVEVKEDGITVYRYFNPVLDVNYSLDEHTAFNNTGISVFDLYVDGEAVETNAYDFCGAIPYGSEYEVVVKNVNPIYTYDTKHKIKGKMYDSRGTAWVSFTTREEGTCKVTCEDWAVDASGKKVKEITSEVDKYLSEGGSKQMYPLLQRSVEFKKGDIVSGELWGNDTTGGAYSDDYVYVASSKEVSAKGNETKVYRYFYPVFDVNGELNGEALTNTSKIAKFNVYIDGKLVAENVTDFFKGIPCGAEYRVEISEYTNWSYILSNKDEASGKIGTGKRLVGLAFDSRKGDATVKVEDWIVDKNNNKIKEITNNVDAFLGAGKSRMKYSAQPRTLKANAGEVINPSLFGNDKNPKAYEDDYVYAGSSEAVTVQGDTTVYRYFYPVLDVNALVDSDNSIGNVSGIAKFSVYVDGKSDINEAEDFCGGVPYGSQYEIKNIKPKAGYELLKATYSGIMGETESFVDLRFKSAK